MPAHASRRNHSALIRFGIIAFLLAASTILSAQEIVEFPVPTPNADLRSITVGPDGALWFNEAGVQKIGRITTDGVVTEFDVSFANFGIATGYDGNIWFAAEGGVGRLTPSGTVTIFPPPDGGEFTAWDIVRGPENAMWCTNIWGQIGRITMAGVMTLFPIPNSEDEQIYGLAAGSDGNIWYANPGHGVVGRMTPAGVFTEFPVYAYFLTPGPDGAIWFSGTEVGRITTSGDIFNFPVQSTYQIATGPDNNLWFPTSLTKLGRLTPSGVLTEFDVPTVVPTPYGPGSVPYGVVAGPDGNVWFTEEFGNKIGRLTPSGDGGQLLCAPNDQTLCLNHNRFSVRAAWKETPTGPSTPAHAVAMTGDAGYFWFLAPDNVEVVVKVLKACADPFNSYWVFAAGLTNLGVDMTVTDMHAGVTKTYPNAPGTPFAPIQDTAAFATCP